MLIGPYIYNAKFPTLLHTDSLCWFFFSHKPGSWKGLGWRSRKCVGWCASIYMRQPYTSELHCTFTGRVATTTRESEFCRRICKQGQILWKGKAKAWHNKNIIGAQWLGGGCSGVCNQAPLFSSPHFLSISQMAFDLFLFSPFHTFLTTESLPQFPQCFFIHKQELDQDMASNFWREVWRRLVFFSMSTRKLFWS